MYICICIKYFYFQFVIYIYFASNKNIYSGIHKKWLDIIMKWLSIIIRIVTTAKKIQEQTLKQWNNKRLQYWFAADRSHIREYNIQGWPLQIMNKNNACIS